MIIKSSEVRKSIRSIWPKLRFMVLSDEEWWLPEIDEVRLAINEVAVDRLTYMVNLFECEEFALSLVVAIRGHRADLAVRNDLPAKNQLIQLRNWPLGIVVGKRFRGEDTNHWINFILTKQGQYLIEPQTGEMWQPMPSNDDIYFLFM